MGSCCDVIIIIIVCSYAISMLHGQSLAVAERPLHHAKLQLLARTAHSDLLYHGHAA